MKQLCKDSLAIFLMVDGIVWQEQSWQARKPESREGLSLSVLLRTI